MTRKEIIKWLKSLKAEIGKPEHRALWHYAESIDVVIKALLASGDLISRADAIDAVEKAKATDPFGRYDKQNIGIDWALDALKALPSADTDMSEYCDRLWKIAYERGKAETEQHNKDAISREGLLKSWEELSPRGRTEFDQVIMTIPALPSAEAEPKRVLQGYCKGADCRWWNPQVEGCNRCVFVKDEYTHPSAEADSDDLIIKGAKGIQDGLYNIKDGKLSKYYAKGGIVQAYEIVPSAEAVQGEWIDIDNYYRMATCSHCHKVTMFEKWGEYTKPYDFCPNCGSRMTKGGDTE